MVHLSASLASIAVMEEYTAQMSDVKRPLKSDGALVGQVEIDRWCNAAQNNDSAPMSRCNAIQSVLKRWLKMSVRANGLGVPFGIILDTTVPEDSSDGRHRVWDS